MPIQESFKQFQCNRGHCYERTKHGRLEKAFADHWESENEERPGFNAGLGLLQNLFFSGHCPNYRCVHEVSDRERYVAATVVQWLGTNCGMAFLQSVLREEGLYIADIPKFEPLPEKPKEPSRYSRKIC